MNFFNNYIVFLFMIFNCNQMMTAVETSSYFIGNTLDKTALSHIDNLINITTVYIVSNLYFLLFKQLLLLEASLEL